MSRLSLIISGGLDGRLRSVRELNAATEALLGIAELEDGRSGELFTRQMAKVDCALDSLPNGIPAVAKASLDILSALDGEEKKKKKKEVKQQQLGEVEEEEEEEEAAAAVTLRTAAPSPTNSRSGGLVITVQSVSTRRRGSPPSP